MGGYCSQSIVGRSSPGGHSTRGGFFPGSFVPSRTPCWKARRLLGALTVVGEQSQHQESSIDHRYRYKISEIDMDVVRDFQRGALRLHVLHHASIGEVHGAWLMEELARRGYRVGPGTIYPLLAGLE